MTTVARVAHGACCQSAGAAAQTSTVLVPRVRAEPNTHSTGLRTPKEKVVAGAGPPSRSFSYSHTRVRRTRCVQGRR